MDGIVVEVLGVPNILASDRMVDKLTIHFLRPRNGGGEVQRVLFPSDSPGQAFVIFEEPEGRRSTVTDGGVTYIYSVAELDMKGIRDKNGCNEYMSQY